MKTAKEWNTAVFDRQKALENEWLKDAREVVSIYEADDPIKVPFNILYSNTETLLPALYNSTPRPEVSPRYSSMSRNRKLDAAVAATSERVLEYTADTNSGRYEAFDEATQDAVLQALVPGQGQIRVRFKESGEAQQICVESVAFDRFIWAYARKWQQVPWVAYGHDLNKAGFEEQFPAFAKKAEYKKINWKALEEKAAQGKSIWEPDTAAKDKKREPTLLVWEIWEYESKKIFYVCDEFETEFLDQEAYPFDITSRFPSPKPLQFLKRVNTTCPRPLYTEYKSQAEELNDITRRLKRIIKAIKVRGIYHPALSVLETLLKDDQENGLVPAEQAQTLADSGGLDKFIWLMPTQELVQTALALYDAREKCKGTIYEIMGIGDILRGASVASETAKAQEIKNQWGSLRVKRMQKDVQGFCRNTFRVVLEFAANQYAPLTFKQITGLPYLFDNQKQMLQQQMQQMQQQAQLMAQQAQMTGQQPPQPPPPPQEAMMLQFPSWEEIMAVLRGPFERGYRIDIETNSTVDLEATEDKAAIGEFMNAFGQMTAGLAPMVESKQLPFEASKVILGETFRRFRFGRRVQDALEMMQEPQPPMDQKAVAEKHAAEMAKVQAESARKVGEMQETILEMTGDIERLRTELQATKVEASLEKTGAEIEKKNMTVDRASREFDLKTTFKGTLEQQKKVADEKTMALNDEKAKGQIKELITKKEQEFASREQALKDEVQKLQSHMNEMQAQAKMQAQADGLVSAKESAMLERMQKAQQMFLDAIGEAVKTISAPRQSRIVIDPATGEKRAVSEIVKQ